MKKIQQYFKNSLLLIFCFSSIGLVAQTTIKETKNTNVASYFNESRWLMPSFENASVFLKKSRTDAKVNYDLLTEKLLFIDKNNDTLAIQNTKDITIVQIGKRYFKYYGDIFVEIIHQSDNSAIWLRRQIKKTDSQRIGAYGMPSATSSITNINSIDVGGHFRDIDVVELAKYDNIATFYLSKGSKVRIANKSGFLKTYPKKKSAIEQYLKERALDLDVLEDIIKLNDFCEQ